MMSEEVKEILEALKRCDNTYLKIENSNGEKEYEYHQVNDLRLDGYHSQLLLDYITNLQKENEELKDLKIRKDVVIDYIEKKEKDDDNWIGYELLIEPIRIKNILGGD